jgi:predicted DNA-binding transcriptional regulator AlpA
LPIPAPYSPPQTLAEIPGAEAAAAPRLERFMTLQEVMAATGQAKPTIYRKMAAGQFPRNLRLEVKEGAKRSIAIWVESEVALWQAQQIAKRDGRRP